MKTTAICPGCSFEFTRSHTVYNPPKFCGRACANRAPGRMTPEIRARIGRGGSENHNFKGGWEQANGWSGRRYGFVWVAPEQRHLHPTLNRKGVMRRSHYVWNITHPDNPVLKGQVIHHVNNDSLDDRPENLEKKIDQADHMKSHEPGNWRTRARDAEGHFI